MPNWCSTSLPCSQPTSSLNIRQDTVTKLKLKQAQTTSDYQQLQAQREREIIQGRRMAATDVIRQYARDNAWTPQETEQVISMLGLDTEPSLLGGNAWAGFNNKY